MRPKIKPSEILQKRLEVIKFLLGPGWLGMPWSGWHGNDITSIDISADSWRNAERIYNDVATWLIDGLARTKEMPFCNSAPKGVELDDLHGAIGVPAVVMQILRQGLSVQPAGVETSCHISGYDLLHCIVPFLAYLYCLHDHRLALPNEDRPARCLVALAAVPGAGKSVLTAVLEQFSRLIKTYPRMQVVGMDGWHYPNEVLEAGRIEDESGQEVSLITRKGSPESFDIQGLVSDMDQLRRDPKGADLPVYDRRLHESVANATTVNAPIVLVEGNYLLLTSGRGWEQIGRMMDAGIWLEVLLDMARRAIINRHKALGRNEEESHIKWRYNDWPNSLAALRGRSNSDAIVYEDDQRRLRFVHRLSTASD